MPSKRLLIVDDDSATRTGLSEFLESAGFECVEAATYHEAMMALRIAPPDLLITDIRLGAYNGLQLVINRPPRVSAIVITGFPDPVLETEAERSGARYVRKPISPRDLLELVRQTVGVDAADQNDGNAD